METSINLRVNAGQAKSEVEGARKSLEELVLTLERLKGEGDWSGAAEEIRKLEEAKGAQVQAGNPAAGSSLAGIAGQGSQAQSLKSLEMRIEELTRASEELSRQLEKAAESGDKGASETLSATLNNVEQERRSLQEEKAGIEKSPEEDKGSLERALRSFSITQLLGHAVSAYGAYSSYQQSMARGDYIGAEIGKDKSVGGALMGASGNVAMLGALAGAGPIGWVLSAVLGVAGAVKNIQAERLAMMNANADAFQQQFSPASGLARRYANFYWKIDPLQPKIEDPKNPGRMIDNWIRNPLENPNRRDRQEGLPEFIYNQHGFYENNALAERVMKAAAEKSIGTELSPEALLEAAQRMSAHGAKGWEVALNQAREAVMYSQSTGADLGRTQGFLGLVSRFNAGSLDDASQGRRASGMTTGQTDEFLQGLQRVIEEGISGGFVRSTEDVSRTMSMFYRLSGNSPMWQGQYGAERLSRINAGLSGATALGSSSDVIAYGAASDVLAGMDKATAGRLLGGNLTGTYVDAMRLLERGMDVEMFHAIADSIENIEGGDAAAQIERWRQIAGGSYQAGHALWQMSQKRHEKGVTQEELDREFSAKSKGEAAYYSNLSAEQGLRNELAGLIAGEGADDFYKRMEELYGKVLKARGGGAGDVMKGLLGLDGETFEAVNAGVGEIGGPSNAAERALHNFFGDASEKQFKREFSEGLEQAKFHWGKDKSPRELRDVLKYNQSGGWDTSTLHFGTYLDLMKKTGQGHVEGDLFDLFMKHHSGAKELAPQQAEYMNAAIYKIIEAARESGRGNKVEEHEVKAARAGVAGASESLMSGNYEEFVRIISEGIRRAFPDIAITVESSE